ncbi:TetR/AcrR family transcriptional regulator [Nonomuraea guangzhouensis]|uniref:TetR/AcrR family transcriptional regulator n=1 Tax=Nonomuraea guangzhouensis TaxID=1291555 RepID=A0ABW4GWA3_9ACTN|nr:TetR/AcrR family transcriptional regulator [Nonomuraea guangzhouensis]
MTQRNNGIDNRRTDTRDRILAVAMRLFADRGYTNTSLREIAEELDVTKAALYFHYKTKEDIVTAIMRGYLDGITTLIDNANATAPPATLSTRETLVRSVAEHQAHWSPSLVRLIRENYSEISHLPIGVELRATVNRLINALCPPDPDVLDRTRARAVLACLQAGTLAAAEESGDGQVIRQATLDIALEVLRGGSPSTPVEHADDARARPGAAVPLTPQV